MMKQYHQVRVFCIFALLISVRLNAIAFHDSLRVTESSFLTPRFRSLQVDYATVVLSSKLSGSADFDLKELRAKNSNKPVFVGYCAGIERITIYRFGTEAFGSPFTDYNVFARLTVPGSGYRMDSCLGYSYRKSSRSITSLLPFIPADRGTLKAGFNMKWMLIKQYFGLMLKLDVMPIDRENTLSGGIGVVLAWE
jgi:hypothetical protein